MGTIVMGGAAEGSHVEEFGAKRGRRGCSDEQKRRMVAESLSRARPAGPVLHADDTFVKVLDPSRG